MAGAEGLQGLVEHVRQICSGSDENFAPCQSRKMSHIGFKAILPDKDNRKAAARLRQGLDIQFMTFSIGYEKDVTCFGSGNHTGECIAYFSSSRRSLQPRNKGVQAAPAISRAHMSKRIVEFPE